MPINNITQTISTIPPAGARGVDVQTQFVIKQEDFQDHLQGTTVTELNTLKDQLNTRIGEINSTATTMNGYADTASAGASTATTKAGEASTSASGALTSRNQAETFKNNASASATKASQWADNNYNVEVETGKYSAKHWSVVAENVVGDTVKLTGNQTVTGVKTFSSIISGSITGNAGTATKLATARTINGVSFDGSDNITVSDSTAVKLTGNQTVAGVKTFSSSPVVPTPTTNTQAANKAYVDDNIEPMWVANDARAKTALNASGTAPIYACRAWVNFNGTGTVAIRASGNVSSITDNGTGDYTVNFTTVMPDDNYSIGGMVRQDANAVSVGIACIKYTTIPTTSYFNLSTGTDGGSKVDVSYATVSIFI